MRLFDPGVKQKNIYLLREIRKEELNIIAQRPDELTHTVAIQSSNKKQEADSGENVI